MARLIWSASRFFFSSPATELRELAVAGEPQRDDLPDRKARVEQFPGEDVAAKVLLRTDGAVLRLQGEDAAVKVEQEHAGGEDGDETCAVEALMIADRLPDVDAGADEGQDEEAEQHDVEQRHDAGVAGVGLCLH